MKETKKKQVVNVDRYSVDDILSSNQFSLVDKAFLVASLDKTKKYSIDEAKRELEKTLKGVVK